MTHSVEVQPSVEEMQRDHKHWLHEIKRWESYVRSWTRHQQDLLDDIARLQQSVEEHGQELTAHADAIERHKREILSCERASFEHARGAEVGALAERHLRGETGHEQLLKEHEHLKQFHHTLSAALALLKHQPLHGE
jgi:chromosome segregation ATPase